MKLRVIAGGLIASVLLVGGCGSDSAPKIAASPVATSSEPVSQADDIAAIKALFEEYRRHLLERNGAGIPELVSPNTVDYYGDLARLAATAGPDELARRSLIDRFTVARLRVDKPADQLAAMDGPALLAYGVDQGYIDESSVADNQLGDIRIAGDRGFAQLVVRSKPADVDYEFVRVGPDWKFDLAATFPLANAAFSQSAREGGITDDEFVFEMIELTTGEPVDASIYNRP